MGPLFTYPRLDIVPHLLNMPEFGLELLIDVEHNRARFIVFYDTDQSENKLLFMKMGKRPAGFGA